MGKIGEGDGTRMGKGVSGRGKGKNGRERVAKDMFYFYFINPATPGIPASSLIFFRRSPPLRRPLDSLGRG